MTCDRCGREAGHLPRCEVVDDLARTFMEVSGIHVTADRGAWTAALARPPRDEEDDDEG